MVKTKDIFRTEKHKLVGQNMRKMQGGTVLYCVLFHILMNSKGSIRISVYLKKISALGMSVELASGCMPTGSMV